MLPIVMIVVLTFGSYQLGEAAEYTTKEGDTIRTVGRQVGHTVRHIQKMNSLFFANDEELPVGTVITFISEEDLKHAQTYLEQMLVQADETDKPRWKALLYPLEGTYTVTGLSYDGDPSRLTWQKVLAFARTQRQLDVALLTPSP